MDISALIVNIRTLLQHTFAAVDGWIDKPSALRAYSPNNGGWSIDFESPRKISWSSKGWGITTFHAWQIMPTDSGSKITLEHTQKGWLSQLLHFFLPKRMEKYHLEWLECLQKKLQENP